MNPKKHTPRHIIIKLTKLKDKENVKGSREETDNDIQGSSDKASSCLISRNTISQKGMARNMPSNESKGLQPRLLYPERLSFKKEAK